MRLALVRASAVGALVAVVLGGVRTVDRLDDERARLSEQEAARAAAVRARLPVELFDGWRARLGPGDRWWLDIPEGPAVGLTSLGAVYRTYATFWFLPAVPASAREDATVIFQLHILR